jgi:hypothetical protein
MDGTLESTSTCMYMYMYNYITCSYCISAQVGGNMHVDRGRDTVLHCTQGNNLSTVIAYKMYHR